MAAVIPIDRHAPRERCSVCEQDKPGRYHDAGPGEAPLWVCEFCSSEFAVGAEADRLAAGRPAPPAAKRPNEDPELVALLEKLEQAAGAVATRARTQGQHGIAFDAETAARDARRVLDGGNPDFDPPF